MKTLGELALEPVWVNPSHRVSSAKILLAGHRLRALGVIDGEKLLGTVGYEEMAAASDTDVVGDFGRPLGAFASPYDPIRVVADIMAREMLDYLPVVEEGRFLGIVTATMLLRETSRSWDPLTGLSWSDDLRAWGIERLKEGRELTILFLDLDDFGNYNKKFGHIVGDRVLGKVAEFLRQVVDPGIDILCRYGGDEFAIGTLRSRRDTEELLRRIERGLQGSLVADSDQPVSFSAGIFGGRRSKERENVHLSATLDTLINMASKAAMAAKEGKRAAATPPSEAPLDQPVSVVEVFHTGNSPTSLTTVILSHRDKVASGVHTRGDLTASQSVVAAAAKALERLMGGLQFEFREVQLSEDEQGDRYVTVTGQSGSNGAMHPVSASRRVGADVYRSAAEALVEAALSG